MTAQTISVEAIKSALRCSRPGCSCKRGPNVHCPCHEDRDPSFTVHEKNGGMILVNCKKGCEQKDVIARLREMKLWPDAAKGQENGQSRPTDMAAAVYEYRTVDGELVGIKGRFEQQGGGKTFKWKLPGRDAWGMEGMPISEMPLWGADILAIAPQQERVYFVEGEKAALACRAMGLLAVTLPGGASTRDFGEALEVLRGRDVVLWPDNDDPGRKLMDRVRSAVRSIARSVVTIFPPVPEKGDAVEYFGTGHTLEQLAALVPAPPRPVMEYLDSDESEGCIFQREGLGYSAIFAQQGVILTLDKLRRASGELRGEILVESTLPTIPRHLFWGGLILSSGANRQKVGHTLESRTKGMSIDWDGILEVLCRKVALAERQGEPFTTAGDMDANASITDWAVNDFAPRLETTSIFGDGGVGKSMLTLAIGISVKAGMEIVPGFSPIIQGNVLYLDWEASRQRLDARVKRICEGTGIQPVVMGYRRCAPPLVDQVEEVLRYCQSEGVVLVIIDSVEMAMNGTGGESTDPNDKVIRLYSALRHLGRTAILVDHISAATRGQKEGAGKAIGGIFKRNLARMAFELRKGTDVVKPNEMNIGLYNIKRNDDGPPMKTIGLRVEFGPDWTRYYREDVGDSGLIAGLSVRERMKLILKRDGALSVDDLAERTQAAKANVKTELSRWAGSLFVKLPDKRYGLVVAAQGSLPGQAGGNDEIPF